MNPADKTSQKPAFTCLW